MFSSSSRACCKLTVLDAFDFQVFGSIGGVGVEIVFNGEIRLASLKSVSLILVESDLEIRVDVTTEFMEVFFDMLAVLFRETIYQGDGFQRPKFLKANIIKDYQSVILCRDDYEEVTNEFNGLLRCGELPAKLSRNNKLPFNTVMMKSSLTSSLPIAKIAISPLKSKAYYKKVGKSWKQDYLLSVLHELGSWRFARRKKRELGRFDYLGTLIASSRVASSRFVVPGKSGSRVVVPVKCGTWKLVLEKLGTGKKGSLNRFRERFPDDRVILERSIPGNKPGKRGTHEKWFSREGGKREVLFLGSVFLDSNLPLVLLGRSTKRSIVRVYPHFITSSLRKALHECDEESKQIILRCPKTFQPSGKAWAWHSHEPKFEPWERSLALWIKSREVEEKMHEAEARLAGANRKSLELDRRMQELHSDGVLKNNRLTVWCSCPHYSCPCSTAGSIYTTWCVSLQHILVRLPYSPATYPLPATYVQMAQKQICSGPIYDRLPPVSANYPWLVAQTLEEKDDNVNGEQIFYTVQNPTSLYRCRIPELLGRHIQGCFHGWVVLSNKDLDKWSLWNPVTSKFICLPRLILKDGGDSDEIGHCCLSSPPDDPGSILLFTRYSKPNIVFCRLDRKRKKLRWIEMSYSKQLMSITDIAEIELLHQPTCCNGKVYALTTRFDVIHLDIEVKEKQVVISLVRFARGPRGLLPGRPYSEFLKGSCEGLFVILVVTARNSSRPIGCKRSVTLSPPITSKLGGYIHLLDETRKVVYSYDVKDKIVSMSSMPFLDLLGNSQRIHFSVWTMPEFRFEGDNGEDECKYDAKQEEGKEDRTLVRSCKNDEVEFYGETNELQLLNLPFHVLEMIMKFSVGVEYLNFRATCKHCHLAAPVIQWNNEKARIRLQTYSLSSPWLMTFEKDRCIMTFTDPMFGDKYYIKASQELFYDKRILCSRYGWLLLFIDFERIVFFNPFTSDIRELPRVDHVDTFNFSAPPTSPDCVVVAFSKMHGMFYIHNVGREPFWRNLEFGAATVSFFEFPVFCGRDVYALTRDGGLQVLKDDNQSLETVVAKNPRSCCRESVKNFLVKCNEHLLLVIVGDFGEVEVFKLKDSTKEWEKMDGLGRHMIYICDATCLCVEAKTPEMENKIYFPRFYSKNEKLVFYSLDTCRYHTFDGRNVDEALMDIFETKQLYYPQAWIEPIESSYTYLPRTAGFVGLDDQQTETLATLRVAAGTPSHALRLMRLETASGDERVEAVDALDRLVVGVRHFDFRMVIEYAVIESSYTYLPRTVGFVGLYDQQTETLATLRVAAGTPSHALRLMRLETASGDERVEAVDALDRLVVGVRHFDFRMVIEYAVSMIVSGYVCVLTKLYAYPVVVLSFSVRYFPEGKGEGYRVRLRDGNGKAKVAKEMAQKEICSGPMYDRLPPLSANYPWLVAQTLEEKDENVNGEQIFYTVQNPTSLYRCRIPELLGRNIEGCFHGWVVLTNKDRDKWSLWNPVTSKFICLPRLILKDGGDSEDFGHCCLSSPPDDPGSILLFTRYSTPNIVFCRLDRKRKKLRWIEMSYSNQLISITDIGPEYDHFLYQPTCCNGKVYALTTVSLDVIHLHIEVKEKEVVISLVPFASLPVDDMIAGRHHRSFLKGSCEELFIIRVVKGIYGNRPIEVCLYKLDMTSMVWVKMNELKGMVFFIGWWHRSVSWSPPIASELGGYIHILEETRKVIYSYDVKDKIISMSSMHFPDLPGNSHRSHISVWTMPEFRLFEGDNGEAKCKSDAKQDEGKEDWTLVRSRKHDVVEFYGKTNELQLLNLPFHVLEMIMKLCVGLEYLNFRATCKRCHLAAPVIQWSKEKARMRLQTYSLSSPWLMTFEKHRCIITFTDPMFGDKYYIKASQELFYDKRILCSRYGWLLLFIDFKRIVFFNPFTSDIRELPRVPHVDKFHFSAPPTSPDCVVVAFSKLYGSFYLHAVGREPFWRILEFGDAIVSFFDFPVFCGRDVYALTKEGGIQVLKDDNQSLETVVAKSPSSCCRDSVKNFLVKCDEHLLLVIVGDFGEVEVFKLKDSTKEWEKMDGLGRHMIYICDSTCLCMDAKTPEMENKIYFPGFYSKNEKLVFYSLDTCRTGPECRCYCSPHVLSPLTGGGTQERPDDDADKYNQAMVSFGVSVMLHASNSKYCNGFKLTHGGD
ncbi:hypothetical protein OSB04_008953 [Centaurea solstitialis]|uniref:F-box domain-containing protein n=1 Tax=Centaurea solstitialis TaxID=347529 RepID=A0AA38TVA0_9ASTR|nr:hypothetical protein OSB04_008953 [Centaurea solstitialis]